MSEEKLLTLKDLFEHKVKDLYSSQDQLTKAYREMTQHVSHDQLKSLLEKHQQAATQNRDKIADICQELGFDPKGVTCTGTQGIVKEGKEVMEAKADPDVVDAGLLVTAQVMAHYEIANAGAARNYARHLGYDQASTFFDQLVNKEEEFNAKLTEMAKETINADAEKA